MATSAGGISAKSATAAYKLRLKNKQRASLALAHGARNGKKRKRRIVPTSSAC